MIMLHRNIPPLDAFPVPRAPTEVPTAVDVSTLRHILEAGRPPVGVDLGLEAEDGIVGAVLAVHGLGHDGWDFGSLVARRPADLALRVMDLPGFGPAQLDHTAPDAVTLDTMVAALVQQAQSMPRRPVVVASSLGGHVALLAALAHPRLFAGLVLLAPGGLVEAPGPMKAVLRNYYSVEAICARPEDELLRNSRRIFVRPSEASDLLAARKLAIHRSPVKERFARPFAAVVADVLSKPVLAHVQNLRGLPITSIFGDGDVVVPLVAGRTLESRAGGELLVLPRLGHCPHLEDPDLTAELVFARARAMALAAVGA